MQLPENPPLKNASDFKIIGRRTARIDGPDIVSGKASYGIDIKVSGMLYASLERPPFSGAKVKSLQEGSKGSGCQRREVGHQVAARNRCRREFHLGGDQRPDRARGGME